MTEGIKKMYFICDKRRERKCKIKTNKNKQSKALTLSLHE